MWYYNIRNKITEVKKKGEKTMNKITQDLLDEIATYMNDYIRESLHGDYDNLEEISKAYVEILETKFHIECK